MTISEGLQVQSGLWVLALPKPVLWLLHPFGISGQWVPLSSPLSPGSPGTGLWPGGQPWASRETWRGSYRKLRGQRSLGAWNLALALSPHLSGPHLTRLENKECELNL